jgi:hypothetical protein
VPVRLRVPRHDGAHERGGEGARRRAGGLEAERHGVEPAPEPLVRRVVDELQEAGGGDHGRATGRDVPSREAAGENELVGAGDSSEKEQDSNQQLRRTCPWHAGLWRKRKRRRGGMDATERTGLGLPTYHLVPRTGDHSVSKWRTDGIGGGTG